ncbi:MipA/OmpV family protein [Magnetospira sp. QH-2]|uniref:MipA/OmpV family protein n=1 Tax=Magnetospira sp. (strain QH-2) TaxID=1288970 RepID=UPI0003E81AA9|nr:MipA/OmpV family protein [Magnetospira sp. QH-2]CCQ74837.1 conserved exported protein of unknown function[Include MltA-interacting protein MipA domain] [Magnetospira sp. QH-2]
MNTVKTLLVLAVLAATSSAVIAEETPKTVDAPDSSEAQSSVGLGVAMVPEYDGSEEYEFHLLPTGKLALGRHSIALTGSDLRANLLWGPVTLGPIVSYRAGRDADVKHAQVSLLPEIDGAVELGAHLSVALTDSFALSGEMLADVSDVHRGFHGKLSLDIQQPVTDRLALMGSVSSSFMDSNFAQTYFGVTATGAAASGLSAFDADSGFRDVGLTIGAAYQLTESVSLNGMLGYSHLLGEAGDSPIVKAGSSGQMQAVVGLSYSF